VDHAGSSNRGRGVERTPRSCRPDTVDYRAYARCVPAAWHRGPAPPGGVRGSARWGDPRAQLPDGERWDQVRPRVPPALRLTDPAETLVPDHCIGGRWLIVVAHVLVAAM